MPRFKGQRNLGGGNCLQFIPGAIRERTLRYGVVARRLIGDRRCQHREIQSGDQDQQPRFLAQAST
ncbi:MAG: hypothetical protein ACK5Q5_23915 [Planctomycetaceae bacterium]